MTFNPPVWEQFQKFFRGSFLHVWHSGYDVAQIKPWIHLMISGGIEQGEYHAHVAGPIHGGRRRDSSSFPG